ncbi:hypothetical protein SALBM311S_09934 [Streptomyces alboniger]
MTRSRQAGVNSGADSATVTSRPRRAASLGTLDETVEDFIGDLTDKSPFTMWLTKMTIDRSLDADTQSLMVMEHLAVGVALNSEDAAEGVSAFLEKREPKWQGR